MIPKKPRHTLTAAVMNKAQYQQSHNTANSAHKFRSAAKTGKNQNTAEAADQVSQGQHGSAGEKPTDQGPGDQPAKRTGNNLEVFARPAKKDENRSKRKEKQFDASRKRIQSVRIGRRKQEFRPAHAKCKNCHNQKLYQAHPY